MMMSSLFMLFILLLPMEARCHFLHSQVKQRTNNNNNNHLLKYNPRRRHLSIPPVAFLSIRGGSDAGGNGGDDNDENEDNFFDFVSSFESELMEIRQQAELEAEAELEKLRSMLGEERDIDDDEGSDDEEDNAFIKKEEDDDTSNTVEPEDNNISTDDQNDVDEESSVEEEIKDVSDVDEESSLEVEDTKDQPEDEKRISPTANQLDHKLEGDEGMTELEKTDDEIGGGEKNDEVQTEDEPVSEEIDDSTVKKDTVTTIDDDSDIQKRSKPKRSKAKKSKSNKPTSTRNKSDRNMFDNFESLSEDEVGTVESSVVLTRTIEKEFESRPRGIISSYLKSDLVRALSLLIATIVVSVLMQRLQRQMEAQGL